MNLTVLALPASIFLLITASLLLVSRDWRVSILILALQYIGVFLLVAMQWPVGMALSKLIAGWMSAAVLGIALSGLPVEATAGENSGMRLLVENRPGKNFLSPSGSLFRFLAVGLVLLVVLTISSRAIEFVPGLSREQAFGALVLLGIGLLYLGLTAEPVSVIIGLLTLLSGFEIIYAVVEASTLVTGLLAAVNLGLSLVGAYIMVAPHLSESE